MQPPRIELAVDADVPFLWEMLTYAASMAPGGVASVAEAQANGYLRTYVEGWGRAADLGVVAYDPGGARIGAAWVRAGLIVAEPRAPELAMATVPGQRGHGVGTAMMNQLFRHARSHSHSHSNDRDRWDAIVLSVRATNPALRFYERLGFQRAREVTNRVGGLSYVMRRPF